MKVQVNDMEYSFNETELTITDLLAKMNMSTTGVVAEMDGEVFNNREFNSRKIKDGARIELIRIVGGG